jgi:hypothetical protein
VLFFSLLLDGVESSKCWSIFHDIYINASTMETIRAQSSKLSALSESLEVWKSGPYNDILKMGSIETLNRIHRYWLKYSNIATRNVLHETQAAMKKVFLKYYAEKDMFIAPLIRSFGPANGLWQRIVDHHIRQYWQIGVADIRDQPKEPTCNPLFLYSSTAGSKFALHQESHPLAMYHLGVVSVREPFNPKDRYDHEKRIREYMPKALLEAKSQFQLWCQAFQASCAGDPRVTIRFVVADPMALCYALHPEHAEFMANYSAPWSSSPLELEDGVVAPYPIIDTSNLIDTVGPISVLVATVPILEESPTSSLYTETASRPWPLETSLLDDFLGKPNIMCCVLGIAPVAYLTGVSNSGLGHEPLVIKSNDRESPIPLQIIWKIPSGGDVDVKIQPKLCFDREEFGTYLFAIYLRMFAREEGIQKVLMGSIEQSVARNRLPSFGYTRAGFAAFVAFLKRRHETDFEAAVTLFYRFLRNTQGEKSSVEDLLMHLAYFGVVPLPKADLPTVEEVNAFLPTIGDTGPPLDPKKYGKPVDSISLTVPRARLRAVSQRFMEKMNVRYDFHVRLHVSPTLFHTFSSPSACFGTFVGDLDDRTRILFGDDGWAGISDLNVCFVLPAVLLYTVPLDQISVSFNLTAKPATNKLFRKHYGQELEIFRAALLDENHVRILGSLPGYPPKEPSVFPESDKRPAESNHRFTKSHPTLQLGKTSFASFTTRITLRNDDDFPASVIVAEQTSACVVVIRYNGIVEACQFPFPIVGRPPTTCIDRQSRWIELNVPLYNPARREGGYFRRFMPLIRDADGSLCSWSLPSVNFKTIEHLKDMPTRDSPGNNWHGNFILTLFSDRESDEIKANTDNGDNLKFMKKSMGIVLNHIYGDRKQSIINFGTDGRTCFVLFIPGVYFDFSLQTIVAKAYILYLPSDFVQKYPHIESILSSLPVRKDEKNIQVGQDELRCWNRAFPAMVERCRSWEHKESCQYSTTNLLSTSVESRTFCSCGMGKVDEDFLKVKQWKGMEKYVTRCALSAVFPAPYMEETRQRQLAMVKEMRRRVTTVSDKFTQLSLNPSMAATCQVCGSEKDAKKCSLCGRVVYCSRACQKEDWPKHKVVCPALSKISASQADTRGSHLLC